LEVGCSADSTTGIVIPTTSGENGGGVPEMDPFNPKAGIDPMREGGTARCPYPFWFPGSIENRRKCPTASGAANGAAGNGLITVFERMAGVPGARHESFCQREILPSLRDGAGDGTGNAGGGLDFFYSKSIS